MKIAILGSHPATVYMAPFGDLDWQIWACSPHNFERRDLPRIDQWFEVHDPAADKTRSDLYLEFVRSLTPAIPVWMRDRSRHPLARPYPEAEIRAEFSPFHFTSSLTWMVAKAILEQPETIGFWGILQASRTEYAQQRPGLQYFFNEAHRRGIDIVVPAVTGLFDPPENQW